MGEKHPLIIATWNQEGKWLSLQDISFRCNISQIIGEHMAVRKAVGIFDGPIWKHFRGKDA